MSDYVQPTRQDEDDMTTALTILELTAERDAIRADRDRFMAATEITLKARDKQIKDLQIDKDAIEFAAFENARERKQWADHARKAEAEVAALRTKLAALEQENAKLRRDR